MDKLQLLGQLGLNDKEIKIYEALLNNGLSLVSAIGKQTGIKRPSVYFTLEKLIKKGFVSRTILNKKEVFQTEDPNVLKRIAKEQSEKTKNLENAIKKLVPHLKKTRQKKLITPKIRILEEKEGLWNVGDDTLKEGEDIYVFGSFQKLYDIYSTKRMNEYEKQRMMHRLKLHVLTDIHPESVRGYKNQDFLLSEYRFLPPSTSIDTYFIIYGNKTFLASAKKPLAGVVIEDETITFAIKMMFDALWKEMEGKNLPL